MTETTQNEGDSNDEDKQLSTNSNRAVRLSKRSCQPKWWYLESVYPEETSRASHFNAIDVDYRDEQLEIEHRFASAAKSDLDSMHYHVTLNTVILDAIWTIKRKL